LHRRAIGLAALAVLALLAALFAWQRRQPSEKPSEQLAEKQVKTLASPIIWPRYTPRSAKPTKPLIG